MLAALFLIATMLPVAASAQTTAVPASTDATTAATTPSETAPRDAAAAATIAADLSRAVQAQVATVLSRYLRPDEFQVFAKVTPATTTKTIPYLPETLPPIAGSQASPGSLATLVQRVELDVIVADRYDNDTRTKLRGLLIRALALDEARGDKITFSSLGLKLDRPEPDIARDLARSEAETRDVRTRLDALSRERDDAKREASDAKRDLTVLKTELDRVAREKAPEASDAAAAGAAAPNALPRSFWSEYAALIVAGVIALLAIFASSAALRGAAKNLSEAVQTIGTGLPALGERLSESLSQGSQLALPSADTGNNEKSTASSPSVAAAAMPMEAVSRRVIELHEELSVTVNADNEGLVLEYLSYLLVLDDEASTGRAVASMELLGKEKANQLYNRLPSVLQQKVFTFLRTGTHARPKGEVMLEAGEELKTKIFGANFSSRVKLGEDVSRKLLQVSIDDQVAVARSLDGESLARFFLYLEPAKVGAVLSRLREKDPKRFDKAALLVTKVPEVETSSNLDKDIGAALEAQIARTTADIQAPYLQYYKSIVESVEDDVAEALAEHFAAANPRVDRFVRESIVTFGTFFKLHGDIQEEIVANLSNKDVAALVASIKPELKTAVYAHLEERRRDLVEEEIDRLSQRGARQVVALHRAAKRQIVARIGQIKGDGPLSDLLAKQVESLPAAAAAAGPRAA